MFRLDKEFARGYCEAIDCPYLFIQTSRYKIRGKQKSRFCSKPELLRAHLAEHFQAGGEGAAKLLRGEEEAFVLTSQALHFVSLGRGEIVSEKPLVVRLKSTESSPQT